MWKVYGTVHMSRDQLPSAPTRKPRLRYPRHVNLAHFLIARECLRWGRGGGFILQDEITFEGWERWRRTQQGMPCPPCLLATVGGLTQCERTPTAVGHLDLRHAHSEADFDHVRVSYSPPTLASVGHQWTVRTNRGPLLELVYPVRATGMQPMLILTVQWWPAPVSVGGLWCPSKPKNLFP